MNRYGVGIRMSAWGALDRCASARGTVMRASACDRVVENGLGRGASACACGNEARMQERGSERERKRKESVFEASMESAGVWFGQLCAGMGYMDEGYYL